MPLAEFDIIERFFRARDGARPEVRVGIGEGEGGTTPPPPP